MNRERTPAVSVLLPVFNGARFLREAVDSVLGQSLADFELVAVDDGSTDDSRAILADYARRDQRVRPLYGPHRGLVWSLNAGMEACRAPWVARMDGDDICVADRLEAQLGFVERNRGVGLVATYAHYVGENGAEVLGEYRLGPTTIEELERALQAEQLVHFIHPTVMMDRSTVIRSGGYDPTFRYAEDLELFNRLAGSGTVCLALPMPKLRYRVHGTSMMIRSHLEMFSWARFVDEVMRARRRGLPIPDYNTFMAGERARPWPHRLLRRSVDVGAYLYRRGGVERGKGRRVRAAACVSAAFCLTPLYVLRKLRSQLMPRHQAG